MCFIMMVRTDTYMEYIIWIKKGKSVRGLALNIQEAVRLHQIVVKTIQ